LVVSLSSVSFTKPPNHFLETSVYRFRLKANCGSHDVSTEKEVKFVSAGQVLTSNKPLHEMFMEKFELLSSDIADEEDAPVPDLVDKTSIFPLATEKGLKVFRSRETKQYQIVDAASEEVIEKDMSRSDVESFLTPEEEKPKKKKKKSE
jgi:hypothetical protein